MQHAVVTAGPFAEADFDALIGPHLEAGYRTALAILRDPDEARDAVQDAAFKAWRRMRQLHDPASARPWFLAGGLDPWNVGEALRLSGAPIADVSSGVERGAGLKDPALILALLEAVRRA